MTSNLETRKIKAIIESTERGTGAYGKKSPVGIIYLPMEKT
jgi:hypothetical protein